MIEWMIDQAAGYESPALDEAKALAFIALVWECIWTRLPEEALADACLRRLFSGASTVRTRP